MEQQRMQTMNFFIISLKFPYNEVYIPFKIKDNKWTRGWEHTGIKDLRIIEQWRKGKR